MQPHRHAAEPGHHHRPRLSAKAIENLQQEAEHAIREHQLPGECLPNAEDAVRVFIRGHHAAGNRRRPRRLGIFLVSQAVAKRKRRVPGHPKTAGMAPQAAGLIGHGGHRFGNGGEELAQGRFALLIATSLSRFGRLLDHVAKPAAKRPSSHGRRVCHQQRSQRRQVIKPLAHRPQDSLQRGGEVITGAIIASKTTPRAAKASKAGVASQVVPQVVSIQAGSQSKVTTASRLGREG